MLIEHQKRLRAGDRIVSLSELAGIAGVHRDTLYSVMNGNRINERSQHAISRSLATVADSASYQKSRLLSIGLCDAGPKLHFGLNRVNIFNGT
jgi:hypothetical protein